MKIKTIIKSGLLLVVLTAVGMLPVGCSEYDDDIASNYPHDSGYYKLNTQYYEGEWSVDQQVIDTARLEIKNVESQAILSVRLPEDYLIMQIGVNYIVNPGGAPTAYYFVEEGRSKDTWYFGFRPTGILESNNSVFYNNGTFYVTIDDALHEITLASSINGNIIFREKDNQWTIGVPVERIIFTIAKTGEQIERVFDSPLLLYYNTTKRIQ